MAKTQNKQKPAVLMNPLKGTLPDDIEPAYPLNVTEMEHFREIAREMHSHNILHSVDRFQITSAASILNKLIDAKKQLDSIGNTQVYESGAAAPSAEFVVYCKLQEQWLKCVGQLGLSPASRQKITGKSSTSKPTSTTQPQLSIPK